MRSYTATGQRNKILGIGSIAYADGIFDIVKLNNKKRLIGTNIKRHFDGAYAFCIFV